MLIKVFCKFMKLADILFQYIQRLVMLFSHQIHNFLIEQGLGFKRACQAGVSARYWFPTVSMATMPNSSLIPYREIIARASLVACSISLEAPVVMEWKIKHAI